jgi:hypothetical protein
MKDQKAVSAEISCTQQYRYGSRAVKTRGCLPNVAAQSNKQSPIQPLLLQLKHHLFDDQFSLRTQRSPLPTAISALHAVFSSEQNCIASSLLCLLLRKSYLQVLTEDSDSDFDPA